MTTENMLLGHLSDKALGGSLRPPARSPVLVQSPEIDAFLQAWTQELGCFDDFVSVCSLPQSPFKSLEGLRGQIKNSPYRPVQDSHQPVEMAAYQKERCQSSFKDASMAPLCTDSRGIVWFAANIFDESGQPKEVSATGAAMMAVLETCHLSPEQAKVIILTPNEYDQIAPPSGRTTRISLKASGEIAIDKSTLDIYYDLLARAITERASDIHIEPYGQGSRVRIRVDGELRELPMGSDDSMLDPKRAKSLLSVLKNKANLNQAESRRPQDGGISFDQTETREHPELSGYTLRIATLLAQTEGGAGRESAVVRLLNSRSDKASTLSDVGLFHDQVLAIRSQLESPKGIVLVTGPTGSGKTMTLYSMLRELNTPDRKILTVEDPVEIVYPGLSQVSVNRLIGYTFASALRQFLRHDPDVIFVGEIRDSETAEIACEAAETGHLVLSTLHTNDAVASLLRLNDLGVPFFKIGPSLNAIVAQRLVRRLCMDCSEQYDAKDEINKMLRSDLISHPVVMRRPSPEHTKNCTCCNGQGYKGRTAVAEVWEVGSPEKHLMAQGVRDKEKYVEQAILGGFQPLILSGLELALSETTSLKELLNVASATEWKEQRNHVRDFLDRWQSRKNT